VPFRKSSIAPYAGKQEVVSPYAGKQEVVSPYAGKVLKVLRRCPSSIITASQLRHYEEPRSTGKTHGYVNNRRW